LAGIDAKVILDSSFNTFVCDQGITQQRCNYKTYYGGAKIF